MTRFRQLLILSFGLVTLALLGACGKQTSAATTAPRTTITFWHGMTDQHKVALDHLITQFNHSQSRYRVVGRSQGDFATLQQKITAAAKSKTLPTIAQTAYTNVPTYVKGGFITPLDPYLSRSTVRQVTPVFLESANYQQKTYAFPFAKSVRILFYNPKLLKQAGLRVPRTWQELQHDGQRVKARGWTGLALDQSFVGELDQLIHQTGRPLVSSQLRVNANSHDALAATHVLWDMLQNKTATTAGTDGYGSTQFFAGKTLFYCGSSAAIGVLRNSTPQGFQWRTAPLPSYHGRKATSIAGNDLVLFKSASTAQRRGSAAFMRFLSRPKQTTYWAQKTGYLPLTKSAQKNTIYQHYLKRHPENRAAIASLKFAFQDPAFHGYPQYFMALNQAVDDMTANHTTPKKAMGRLQHQTETIIRQNN